MIDSTGGAGHQLTSGDLYDRQKKQNIDIIAPTVIIAGITDPVNIGSIFRICDAVKCERLIFVDSLENDIKKVKRVSRSTNEYLPYDFVSFNEFTHLAGKLAPLGAIEITSTSSDIYTTPLPPNGAFVIGGERYGIADHILQLCAYAIHIPMFGVNSSMNVATSLGIVLYEWHRRFRYPPS